MQLTKTSALTLVELMTVVVLVGTIAVFAVPNFTKSVNKSYESSATGNLQLLYSAQKLAKNSGAGYQAAADLASLNGNANLNVNILANGFNYSCTLPTGTTFNCKAASVSAAPAFTLQITDSNQNVCCAAGTCPSAPAVGSGTNGC